MTTQQHHTTRAAAWATVDKAWRAGTSNCLMCPHRYEEVDRAPYQEGYAPLVTEVCKLLETGSGNDFLNCPAFADDDDESTSDLADSTPAVRNCVTLHPKSQKAPLVIGGAYVRPPAAHLTTHQERVQIALLEAPAAPPHPFVAFAARFLNRLC